MKKSLEVSLLTLFLFAFELFIYSFTKMNLAAGSGTTASFVAYSFQWLMALTVAIGAAFPLGVFVQRKSGRESAGLVSMLGFVLVVMTGFTAVSFLRISSAKSPAQTPKDLSEFVEYAQAEVKETDAQTLEIELRFKNKSKQDITELDYVFVAVEDVHIFYKIKIREAVYFSAGGTGSTKLTWQRSRLKKPELFDTLKKAYANKTLKVFGKATRITLVDGSVIGE